MTKLREARPTSLYWLPLTEPQIRALALGGVQRDVQHAARRLLKPLTRTDAGVTTAIYRKGRR